MNYVDMAFVVRKKLAANFDASVPERSLEATGHIWTDVQKGQYKKPGQ